MCSWSSALSDYQRTRYELRKAEERDHLPQGLIALLNLDAIIDLIRNAADAPTARQELQFLWSFLRQQMQFCRCSWWRQLPWKQKKIRQEHDACKRRLLTYRISCTAQSASGMAEQVSQLKTTYATPRRTVIDQLEGEFDDADLIANAVILLTEQGYIKRCQYL